jgi:2'-5' RNA ligase
VRLFIAIELPEFVAGHLAKMQDALRPLLEHARWTRPDQLHLTLKFLGETPEQRVSELVDSLRKIKIDDEICLQAHALACFSARGPVRIVAAALQDAQGRCARLQEQIDHACHDVGFMLEGRRWTAHVTLARLKDRNSSAVRQTAAAAVAPLLPGPPFTVGDFALIQSRLDRDGPVYVRVA